MLPFSTKFNDDIFDQKIQVGSVISIDVNNVNHPKWNIILEITKDKCLVASIYINTNPYIGHISSPKLMDLQYEINIENVPKLKLDHTSVIDCSEVFENSYENYKYALINNAAKHKGILPKEILDEVIKKVATSTKTKRKIVKKYKTIFPTKQKKTK